MITGEIKSKINQIWNAFWSGGISNLLEVMEQMTYLLFIRQLDEIQITKEKKANRLKKKLSIQFSHLSKIISVGRSLLHWVMLQHSITWLLMKSSHLLKTLVAKKTVLTAIT